MYLFGMCVCFCAIHHLGHPDAAMRYQGRTAEEWIRSITDTRESAQIKALEAIEFVGEQAAAGAKLISELIDPAHPLPVRHAALAALVSIKSGDPAVAERLCDTWEQSLRIDPKAAFLIVNRCITALSNANQMGLSGHKVGERALSIAIGFVSNRVQNYENRCVAAESIGVFGVKSVAAVKALVALLGESDFRSSFGTLSIRLAAIKALGAACVEAPNELRDCLQKTGIRFDAAVAVCRIGQRAKKPTDSAEDILLAGLGSSSGALRRQAIAALGSEKDIIRRLYERAASPNGNSVVEAYASLLAGEVALDRIDAAVGLGELGEKKVVITPVLIRMLSADFEVDKIAAARILASWGADGVFAIPYLERIVGNESLHFETRRESMSALSSLRKAISK